VWVGAPVNVGESSLRADAAAALPVINSVTAWSELSNGKRSGREGYYAFYSSFTGAITTEASLMTVPIDDHAIVRGHAIFDTTLAAVSLASVVMLPDDKSKTV